MKIFTHLIGTNAFLNTIKLNQVPKKFLNKMYTESYLYYMFDNNWWIKKNKKLIKNK